MSKEENNEVIKEVKPKKEKIEKVETTEKFEKVETTKKESTPGAGKSKIAIIAIVVVLAVILVGIVAYNRVSDMMLLKESVVFQEEMKSASTNITNLKDIDKTIKSKGRVGELEKYYKEKAQDFIDKAKKVQEIQSEMTILSAASVKADMDLSKHKDMITRIKPAINDMYDAMFALANYEDLEKETKRINFPKSFEEEFLGSIKSEYELLTKTAEKQKDLYTSMIEKIEEGVNILADNTDKWQISGTQLLFTDSSLLSKYNSVIRSVQTLQTQISLTK